MRTGNMRLHMIKFFCWILLPKDLWVGKNYGAYTCKYKVTFGKLDSRGVMQGYDIMRGK